MARVVRTTSSILAPTFARAFSSQSSPSTHPLTQSPNPTSSYQNSTLQLHKSPKSTEDLEISIHSPASDPKEEEGLRRDAERLAAFLSAKRRVVALTGAGISTESGLPDYRGPDGAYSKGHKPMTFQEFSSSDLKRKRYWARSMRAWPYFTSVEPNRTHKAVAELERKGFINHVITQNVDGLHNKAGSKGVIELHGNYDVTVCLTCKRVSDRSETQRDLNMRNPEWIVRYSEREKAFFRPDGDVEIAGKPLAESFASFNLPQCVSCSPNEGILKPDVVFFGENVPLAKVDAAFNFVDDADGLLVLGTSLQVMSAYRFAIRAIEKHVPIAIVNLGPTRGDPLAQLKLEQHTGKLLDLTLPLL